MFANAALSVPSLAPMDLTATLSKSQVVLVWSPSIDDGSSVIGYNLYRSTSSDGVYTLIASTTDATYIDSDLIDGQTYWYKVSALNSIGTGVESTPISIASQSASATDNVILFAGVAIAFIAVMVIVIMMARRKE